MTKASRIWFFLNKMTVFFQVTPIQSFRWLFPDLHCKTGYQHGGKDDGCFRPKSFRLCGSTSDRRRHWRLWPIICWTSVCSTSDRRRHWRLWRIICWTSVCSTSDRGRHWRLSRITCWTRKYRSTHPPIWRCRCRFLVDGIEKWNSTYIYVCVCVAWLRM